MRILSNSGSGSYWFQFINDSINVWINELFILLKNKHLENKSHFLIIILRIYTFQTIFGNVHLNTFLRGGKKQLWLTNNIKQTQIFHGSTSQHDHSHLITDSPNLSPPNQDWFKYTLTSCFQPWSLYMTPYLSCDAPLLRILCGNRKKGTVLFRKVLRNLNFELPIYLLPACVVPCCDMFINPGFLSCESSHGLSSVVWQW